MVQREGPVKSIYFPPYGLQGQEFSGHVIWHSDYNIKYLTVKMDLSLSFLHLYNVEDNAFFVNENKNELEVKKVIENGYFGFVVSSSILSSPSESATIYFKINFFSDQETIEYREFNVKLIRPELIISQIKENIEVRMPKNALLPKIEPKIILSNKGSGTALVVILPGKDSPLKFGNFFRNETAEFLESVEKSFGRLKEDYPNEVELFDNFILYFKIGKALENDEYEKMQEYKIILEKLNESLQKLKRKDPSMLNDISQTISDVFYSVFSLSKEYESWTTAVESMRGQGILFLNPMSSFELCKKVEKVSLSLMWFDMLGKVYSPISLENLNFILKDTDKATIPIFELFGTEGD